jgi:hypothetical protein
MPDGCGRGPVACSRGLRGGMNNDHFGSPLVDDGTQAADIEWLYPTGLLSVFDHRCPGLRPDVSQFRCARVTVVQCVRRVSFDVQLARQNTWSCASKRRPDMTSKCCAPAAAVRYGVARGNSRSNTSVGPRRERFTEMDANRNSAEHVDEEK